MFRIPEANRLYNNLGLFETCPSFREFSSGRYFCSNFNFVGSVCEFECLSMEAVLKPSISGKLECLPNGRWDKPVPCCGGMFYDKVLRCIGKLITDMFS